MKLGYKYIYSRKGVEITYTPDTPEEKLIQILQTKFNIDIRVDFKAFACFVYSFDAVDGFVAMPWKEREKALKEAFDIEISERTLRKWCNKLLEAGAVVKLNSNKLVWRTLKVDGKTYRDIVSGDSEAEQEMRDYYSYRRNLLKVMNYADANKELWRKFGCCYYSCKYLQFSAFNDEYGDLLEVYELAKQIIEKEN